MRRRASWRGASTRCPAIRQSRSRTKRCARPRRRGAATSTRTAAAARCGMASPTIPRRIWSTSAPATPQPWVQKFRGAQGLDNLYTCSILAVDLTTGQLKWHYQTVPNDNWDFDNVQQLMLLDLHDQRAHAQGDHAGGEERILLRAGPRDRRVHLRRAVREGELGAAAWARTAGPS